MPETSSERTRPLALITGAASGIGLATARHLAATGHRIIAADVNAEALATLGREAPGTICRTIDVGDAEAVERGIAEICVAHGVPTVLVNAAGILQDNVPPEVMPLEEHDRIWQINYRGSFLCCRALAPRMARSGGGAIVNIASVTALRPLPLFAYGPGKAAIVSLTATLAGHYGRAGVRVNAVAPGYVLTPALESRIAAGLRDGDSLARPSALGRLVLPEEIAEAIGFLVGPSAVAITGITLPVDAGWLAGSAWGSYGGIPDYPPVSE